MDWRDTKFICDIRQDNQEASNCIHEFSNNQIVTENGSAFTNKKFETFLHRNGMQQIRTAPYHPALNGQAERTVQTFKITKNKMLNRDNKSKSAEILNGILYNTSFSN